MFVIFDLDGTLALSEHRAHHLQKQPKDWDVWNAACGEDPPNWQLMQVMELLVRHHTVEIWTGRSDAMRTKTEDWLNEHGGLWATRIPLVMRPLGDHRDDFALKAHWMQIEGKPDLVFEDRKRMVEFWRSQGVICCQVAPGEF